MLVFNRDILTGLATAGDMPFPMKHPTRNKRQRDDGDVNQTHSFASETEASSLKLLKRNIIDLNPWPYTKPRSDQMLPSTKYDEFFTLPMYGTELGRLPVYGPSDSSPASSFNQQWFPEPPTTQNIPSGSHPSVLLGNIFHPDTAAHPSDEFFNQSNQLSGSLPAETHSHTGNPQTLYPQHDPLSFYNNGPIIDPNIWANAPSGLE